MRKKIMECILQKRDAALLYSNFIASGSGYSEEEVYQAVHNYVCTKFMLDSSESDEEPLYRLAEKSIARAVSLGIEVAKESEQATTCGTAGTVHMKTALLMMAMRKDFHAELSFQRLGMARHTKDLGKLVCEYYKDRIKK